MTAAGSRELRLRLVTSAVLIPVFAISFVIGGPVFLAVVLVLTAGATWELLCMAELKGFPTRQLGGIGFAMAIPVVLYAAGSGAEVLLLIAAGIVGIAMTQLFRGTYEQAIATAAVTVFAALYVGVLFGHFVLTREIPRVTAGPYWEGAVLIAVPIVLTWINDSAAYGIGRRWGRRRLMPAVSPGKSVEGAVGALLVTVLMAFPVLALVNRWIPVFGPEDALGAGFLVGVAAPCGDLVESSFKRDAGVKDASRLIPGHGGVLDRFDSLLLTVPAFYYYVRLIVF